MTKRLLLDSEYTIVDSNTITINSSITFTAENLNLIIDTVDNRIVYNFACEDLRATVSGQVITLVDATIDLTDSLTIIMSFQEESALDILDSMDLGTKRLVTALNNMVEQQMETNKYLRKMYNPE